MATREHHADADAIWLDVVAGTVTVSRYVQTLVKMYAFEAPVEAALANTPNVGSLVKRHWGRSTLIARDLFVLGLGPSQLEALPLRDVPRAFRDLAEVLGWLYVVERSMLIHSAIHARLALRLPEAEDAFAYLEHRDSSVGARWRAFGFVVDQHAHDEAFVTRMIDAAHDGFACLLGSVHGRSDAATACSA